VAAFLTCTIEPLRAFPFLLVFPSTILIAWFLGMAGGMPCSLMGVILIDFFLLKGHDLLFMGAHKLLGLAVFFLLSTFLGWSLRRLAHQQSLLRSQELQQRLTLAQAGRQVAEERARISEKLRDNDEILKIALEANEMGLWVWDVLKGTNHWSKEVYRIVGYEIACNPPGSELWIQMIHPEDIERIEEAVAETKLTGRDYHQQYRLLRPDGSLRWIESQGKCQRDDEGRVVRVVGVLADITHRKLTEEAMLRSEKLAIAGRLAASVAHEINNPLEAVGNLLYLITLDKSAVSAHSIASQALEELMRVALITQQTLKFNRQTGAPVITCLSEVLEAVLGMFRGKLRTGAITADVRIVKERNVTCTSGETHQIFANLVSNAIDAMPRGGRLVVRLRPSLDWRDAKTAGMRVTFLDTGAGMNRATMRNIYEPFFTTKADTGNGLGMWVVAQLMERHQGHIKAWSSQRAGASGTAFSVFLPFGKLSPAEGPLRELNAQTSLPPEQIRYIDRMVNTGAYA
jgi:PAS domain S-box-containing protein